MSKLPWHPGNLSRHFHIDQGLFLLDFGPTFYHKAPDGLGQGLDQNQRICRDQRTLTFLLGFNNGRQKWHDGILRWWIAIEKFSSYCLSVTHPGGFCCPLLQVLHLPRDGCKILYHSEVVRNDEIVKHNVVSHWPKLQPYCTLQDINSSHIWYSTTNIHTACFLHKKNTLQITYLKHIFFLHLNG